MVRRCTIFVLKLLLLSNGSQGGERKTPGAGRLPGCRVGQAERHAVEDVCSLGVLHGRTVNQIKPAQLDSTTSGIAFVRPADAKEILLRPRASVPQAILCTINVNKVGAGMDVTVKDAKEKPQTRYKYLFQTGTGTVACDKTPIAQRGACKSKTG